MRDELLEYYERELTFLRQMGAEYAQKYPKIAGRLQLEPDRCEDPHVERMLEAFAFLAARVHLKVDDDFPEITTALLDVVFPHYLRPIPSMSVVQFNLDPERGKLSTGHTVPAGVTLYSKPMQGTTCKFRTCYDTVLWPLSCTRVEWRRPDQVEPRLPARDAAAVLRISLRCNPDVVFNQLDLQSLRFFLNGDSDLVLNLYELLCNNCVQILVRDGASATAKWTPLAGELRPVGFAENEGVLPGSRRSFAGYRLLQEYFAFPDKFFFLDLAGLDQLAALGIQSEAEIAFVIAPFEREERQQPLELNVSTSTLRLGCAPIVNLFSHTAEPILLDQTQPEYLIVADARRRESIEVFSVDEVVGASPGARQLARFEPLYSYRHHGGEGRTGFWHVSRRPVTKGSESRTDLFLSLVDLSARTASPDVETITVRCTCTNHNLPSRLPFGNADGDFELEGGSPIRRIVALRKPTSSLPAPSRAGLQWRLISQLSLNYLSLVSEGKEALQEILRLYNFSGSNYLEKQIAGISGLASRRHFARIVSEYGISAARGTRVEIEFDEAQFVGGGVYLFASVIEKFLGMYVSLNSFTQLIASTKQRKEVLKEWPPRAGEVILI